MEIGSPFDPSSAEWALEAARLAAADALELGRRTNTPVYVIIDGEIVDLVGAPDVEPEAPDTIRENPLQEEFEGKRNWALEALRLAGQDALELARRTGTPYWIQEPGGPVVDLLAEERAAAERAQTESN